MATTNIPFNFSLPGKPTVGKPQLDILTVPEFSFGDVNKKLVSVLERDSRLGKTGPEVQKATRWYKKNIDVVYNAISNIICKHKVSVEMQFEAETIVATFNDPVEPEMEEVEDKRGGKRDKVRTSNKNWWVVYAALTRAEHPSPSDTPAMRRTMHRYALELMKKDGVTRIDSARVIPLVVEMAYCPTEQEAIAAQLRESKAVRNSLWAAHAPYWSYWWGVKRRTMSAD
nr:hypothetical protein 1 [Hubei tombus-like virus 1]